MNNEDITDQQERDEFLLNVRFPEEAKQLPIEYLTDYEQDIVQKCINKEKLTDAELKDLKKLLADYRPFLKKYDVDKVEKNLEDNIRVIKSSKELLSLLDNPDRYRFDMHYRIDGQLLRLQFKLNPLSDSEYMELVDVHTRIFKELNNEEKLVYSKSINQQQLTPEEEKMQKQIEDKIIELFGDVDNNNERITQFLINHVELSEDHNQFSKEDQEKLWHLIDMDTRAVIYAKCEEILKSNERLEVELFPDIR